MVMVTRGPQLEEMDAMTSTIDKAKEIVDRSSRAKPKIAAGGDKVAAFEIDWGETYALRSMVNQRAGYLSDVIRRANLNPFVKSRLQNDLNKIVTDPGILLTRVVGDEE